MEHGGFELGKLGWFAGWLVAVLILFLAGTRLPLALRHGRLRATAFHAAIVAGAVGVAVLANVALTLNDAHIDLTREKIYTPSAQAMKVVDDLKQPVRLTYFYRSQDPEGRRVKEVLGVMARRKRPMPWSGIWTCCDDASPWLWFDTPSTCVWYSKLSIGSSLCPSRKHTVTTFSRSTRCTPIAISASSTDWTNSFRSAASSTPAL